MCANTTLMDETLIQSHNNQKVNKVEDETIIMNTLFKAQKILIDAHKKSKDEEDMLTLFLNAVKI